MTDFLILFALLAWSVAGFVALMRRPDDGKRMHLADAVIYGPLVLMMWLFLWVSRVRVAFKKGMD